MMDATTSSSPPPPTVGLGREETSSLTTQTGENGTTGPFADRTQLERRIEELGRDLWQEARRDPPKRFSNPWFTERVMAATTTDPQLRTQLFRFVDVLPMLETESQVLDHLKGYFAGVPGWLPWLIRTGTAVSRYVGPIRRKYVKTTHWGASTFARKFIAGSNVEEVLATAKGEREAGRGFTLDILGEAVTSTVEADAYQEACRQLLEDVSPVVAQWDDNPTIDRSGLCERPRMNLSIKLSALDPLFDPIDTEGAIARVGERFADLLRIAVKQGAFINVDMEDYSKKDLTIAIFKDVLARPEFLQFTNVGIVMQAYLVDSGRDVDDLILYAKARANPFWIRLVKGAYWDYETIHAQSLHWPIPVWQQKWQSDANFERLSRKLIDNIEHVRLALGSHNLRSVAHGLAYAEQHGLPANAVEIQMLHGMAEGQKEALTEAGYAVRTYMPYGELIPGMAYLVRRLLENTSNEGFIQVGQQADVDLAKLFARPAPANGSASTDGPTVSENTQPDSGTGPDHGPLITTNHTSGNEVVSNKDAKLLAADFVNEPPVDFSRHDRRQVMLDALKSVEKSFPRREPLRIGGEIIKTANQLERFDPSDRSVLVGSTANATADHVDAAVRIAVVHQRIWAKAGVDHRAAILVRAADLMRAKKFELSALIIREVGKPWREATADVDEAIDFCRFYAKQARPLFSTSGADVPGEENRFLHLPRGVVGVISPWNFPLAICTGMVAAALATGNAVLIKPAEQSGLIAAELWKILRAAGVPPEVVHYLPGNGEVAGARMGRASRRCRDRVYRVRGRRAGHQCRRGGRVAHRRWRQTGHCRNGWQKCDHR